MPKDPIAPLIVANEKEKDKTWEEVGTPKLLANWFSRIFAVDLGVFKRLFNLFVGPNEPTGGDRGKIHFKNSNPIALGGIVNGKYKYIYQYPPNTPLMFLNNSVPSGFVNLTPEELTAFNLENGDNFVWAMFKP